MRKAPLSRWLPGVSRGTMAVLLLAAPVAAGAAGFAGTTTLPSGVTSVNSGNTQTITLAPASTVTTLTWTPTTAPVNGTINFLPAGNTEAFVGTPSDLNPTYTVLNRIIPTDTTNAIGFYGKVTSTANTRLWFYSPGGLLIGSTAVFDVGGLVLTTAAPTLNANNSFITSSGGTDSFGFTSPAGSTSAITIQPGATINAVTSAHSNYIVAIAPQINQGGAIGVSGSVALVAAESATFAVDARGLFNITVSSGTTVATNTFVNTGAVGGPNAAPSGSYQRVYMVAVPKNNAISMAISAGGGIGFAVADAANLDGDEIVLSAGSNIADAGSGNPVVAGRAGSGTASLTVGAGTYTSNTYGVSTDTATITDPAANLTFNSDLTVIAPTATVNAQVGTIAVGGDLVVNADNSVDGAAMTALVEAGPGAALQVGTNASALGVNGDLTESASDGLSGVGGSASLTAAGGAITVQGNASVFSNGAWSQSGASNPGGITTQGGSAQLSVTGGGSVAVLGEIEVQAQADGSAADSVYSSPLGFADLGVDAVAGTATITASGAGSSISALKIQTYALATGGTDSATGNGGSAMGGTASIAAASGAVITDTSLTGFIEANANAAGGSPGGEGFGTGGAATAGTAQIIANAGTITMVGQPTLATSAAAYGGSASTSSGNGGAAIGGTALIETLGANGTIVTDTSGDTSAVPSGTAANASAFGGNAAGFSDTGGNAVGGTATVQVTGAGQAITLDHTAQVSALAEALGGAGAGAGGGAATGGLAQLLSNGGGITITSPSLVTSASATGGADNASYSTGNGGNATGGTVHIVTVNGGTIRGQGQVDDLALSASADGGASTSGSGGNALGGNIFLDLDNAVVNLSSSGSVNTLDTSDVGGTSTYGTAGTARSAGGIRLSAPGSVNFDGTDNLAGNTQFYVQAGGSIAVNGTIDASGTGAYLHLWADDLGSGSGTVTLAPGALNLPGNLIDIYYNPSALGTPTDFSAGIAAGTATAYQLVDDVNQLQLVGSYLSQNFALGKNIDASATQGWNNGAGFVPIGGYTAPFTGNFDGLNHTVTNLYINQPNGQEVGLFGQVGAGNGATIVIRDVGVVNAQVSGAFGVGGLIGTIGAASGGGLDNVTVTGSYSSGSVAGNTGVGGLIGDTMRASNVTLTTDHSDADITLSGPGSFDNGGLVGAVLVGSGNAATISEVFATGSITGAANGIDNVGGLIGNNGGALSQAYATGAVTVGADALNIGGLAGANPGTIAQAYATGAVTVGTGSNRVGGLAGVNVGTISESWASSPVSASASTAAGGLVGQNNAAGTITNAYWDSYSTGQANGVGTNAGTVTNLNAVTSDPAQTGADNYAFYQYAYANFPAADWVYDDSATRPIGAWEAPVAFFGVATINSAHQVQLIDLNMGGSYAITQNIDLRGTAGTNDIWGPGGFLPLGGEYADPPFSGTLAGGGHVLSNLTMNPNGGFSAVGLIQDNTGTISDLGLANVNITVSQANFNAGALAGYNSGAITDSFATGTIAVTQMGTESALVGGLVGYNGSADGQPGGATISQSYASVAITGGAVEGSSVVAGGLVGDNEGAISQTFANAAVSGSQTGGLVGESTSTSGPTVTNSYWDTQLTGQSLGCGSTGYSGACSGATGLTTAQTLQAASFAGFAIDTLGGQGLPWRQYEGQTTPLLAAFLTPVTVQPGSVTMQYDAQLPNVGVTTYGAQPALTFGTPQLIGLTQNAGTYYISYSGGLYSNQLGYDFVPAITPGTLVITPAPLTLSATGATKTYDATNFANTGGGVLVSGTYGNDSIGNLSESFTSPNVMGTNGSTIVVNSGYVVNDGNGGNNYTVTLQSAQGTITPAPLTLAAVSDSKVYNATTASFGVPQTIGLMGSDKVNSLTQSFASANAMGANGSTLVVDAGYVVSDGNGGANYTVTLQNAVGTISPAALAVTYAANSATSIYGATISGLSGLTSVTGLEGDDTLASVTSGTASFASTATGHSGVGHYAITGSGLTANSGNYTFSFIQAPGNATALTIDPATLDVIANAQNRSYGAANPALTYSEAGLVNGDTLTGSLATSATPSSNVGNYAITLGSLSAGSNYTLAYTGANLTISPANLTVTYTANPLASIYGTVPSGLGGSVGATGLVLGQTLASVTGGTALFTTTAGATSNVGSYAINGSGIGLASANYSLVTVQAAGNATALTVNPAALTILYTAVSGSRSYGAANPALSGTESASGLVNGDTLASVTSGAASFTSPATVTANVGSYAVTGSGLSGSSLNYSYSYAQAPGNATALTITPARATITYVASPASSIYGNLPTGLSGSESASGLVNGDTLSSVTSGEASFVTSATGQSGVGSYAITGSGLTGYSSNYSFSFVQASGNATALTVAPRPITVTADPQQRPFGTSNPAFTYVVSSSTEGVTQGLVNGDQLTGQLSSAATISSPAGSYAIVQGTLAASANYQLTYVGNILTVLYNVVPIVEVANLVEANLPDQPGNTSPTERQKLLAAELAVLYATLGGHPPQIEQNMINDHPVTTPAPVNEPVTSNGNTSLWSAGAP